MSTHLTHSPSRPLGFSEGSDLTSERRTSFGQVTVSSETTTPPGTTRDVPAGGTATPTIAYFAHRKAAWINEDIASGALVEFQSHGLADYVEIVSVDAIGPRLRFNLLSGSSDTRRLMEYDSWSLRVGPRR